MEEMRQELLRYTEELTGRLSAEAEAIRENTRRFVGYQDGRYIARFEGIIGKIEGAIAKAEGLVARLEADRISDQVRQHVKEDIRSSVRASFGLEPDATAENTDEERLQILQMLEQGAITMEQAEELLSAL